jgi:hypothetical protein
VLSGRFPKGNSGDGGAYTRSGKLTRGHRAPYSVHEVGEDGGPVPWLELPDDGEVVEEDAVDGVSLEGLLGAVGVDSRMRAPLIDDAGAHEGRGSGTAFVWSLGGSLERPK